MSLWLLVLREFTLAKMTSVSLLFTWSSDTLLV
jgi:hypothetical protein